MLILHAVPGGKFWPGKVTGKRPYCSAGPLFCLCESIALYNT